MLINLLSIFSGFIESDLEPLGLAYKKGGNEVINNGHTIQVNYQSGSHLAINGYQYELKQFHFHSPSENHINGKSFAMEVHFVHADKEGNLAVVAVMFEEGDENQTLKKYGPQCLLKQEITTSFHQLFQRMIFYQLIRTIIVSMDH